MVQCVAINCSNRPEKTTGVSFFGFPKDKKLRQAWLCKLKRKNYFPKRNDRLCSEHFEEAHLKYKPWLLRSIGFTPGRQELLPGAVPTIFCYKRKADGEEDGSTALKKKTRGAYLKREHRRVLQGIFNAAKLSEEGQPAAQTTSLETQTVVIPPGTLESDSVVANTQSLETTTDVEVDTHRSRSCQTECDSKSVGTMYKGQMRSKGTSARQQTADVGIQCMPLTPAPEDECSDGSDSDQEQETDEDDPMILRVLANTGSAKIISH